MWPGISSTPYPHASGPSAPALPGLIGGKKVPLKLPLLELLQLARALEAQLSHSAVLCVAPGRAVLAAVCPEASWGMAARCTNIYASLRTALHAAWVSTWHGAGSHRGPLAQRTGRQSSNVPQRRKQGTCFLSMHAHRGCSFGQALHSWVLVTSLSKTLGQCAKEAARNTLFLCTVPASQARRCCDTGMAVGGDESPCVNRGHMSRTGARGPGSASRGCQTGSGSVGRQGCMQGSFGGDIQAVAGKGSSESFSIHKTMFWGGLES